MKETSEEKNKVISSGEIQVESTFDKIFNIERVETRPDKSDLFNRTNQVVSNDRSRASIESGINQLAGITGSEVEDVEGKIPGKPRTVGEIIDFYKNPDKKSKVREIIGDALLTPEERLRTVVRELLKTEAIKEEINSNHRVIGTTIMGFGDGDSAIISTQGLLIFGGGTTKEDAVLGDKSADDVVKNEDLVNGEMKFSIEASKIRKAGRFIKGAAKRLNVDTIDPIGTIKLTRRRTGEEWLLAGVRRPSHTLNKILRSAKALANEDENREKLTQLKEKHPELFRDL